MCLEQQSKMQAFVHTQNHILHNITNWTLKA